MYRRISSWFMVVLLSCSMLVGGCVTTAVAPDGQVQVTEPDYAVVQLLATASIATWAATQKQGIRQEDAQALVAIMESVAQFHADGSPIDANAWSVEIAKQVPQRWQALAIVFVQLTEYQLKKYGVADQIPTPDSVGGKLMAAIMAGAKLGLAPYLSTSQRTFIDGPVRVYWV